MTEKPIAHRLAYRYFDPFGRGQTVLRHAGGLWNGQQPHEAITLYTEAQIDAYTAELLKERDALRDALGQYANPLNWSCDEQGIRRCWEEPGSSSPSAYNGFEAARAALADGDDEP